MASTNLSPDPDSRNPLLAVGTVTAAATAVVAVLVSFGVPLTDDQQAAVLGLVGVLAPLVVAAVGRSRVYAPATVARLLATRPRTTYRAD